MTTAMLCAWACTIVPGWRVFAVGTDWRDSGFDSCAHARTQMPPMAIGRRSLNCIFITIHPRLIVVTHAYYSSDKTPEQSLQLDLLHLPVDKAAQHLQF